MMKFILFIHILLLPFYSVAGYLTIQIDNDALYKTDNHYTHGTKITYENNDIKWSIAQEIYTPVNFFIDIPDSYDRPYAGLLYGSFHEAEPLGKHIYNQIELSLGIIGRYSFAEKTQKLFHDLVNDPEPQGWDFQIKDKFFAQIKGEVIGEILTTKYLNSKAYFGYNLGSIVAETGVGCELIAGYNTPRYLNEPLLNKTVDFSSYMFVDAFHKYIGYNRLLENKFTRINPENHVFELTTGIGAIWKDFEIRYSQSVISKEFTEQYKDSIFGSLMLRTKL